MSILLELHELSSAHFKPVSFSLRAGECLAVGGPSGVGKSQLLRAIADLDVHQGEVLLEGRPQKEYTPQAWRKAVGLLPAESGWWGETVREHFGVVDEKWLNELGFTADALDWRVGRLSSGERQRLALLRLLANRPRVLLLDEPTANLDAANTRGVERLVREYLGEMRAAAVWVSHDPMQRARVGGRELLIDDKQVAA
ncbi:MAG: ATP-binding cassette domain-containing protein [Gammaproteobacteria bacterium]|jgi:putative ABC transport system ATP-binding protein